MLSPSTPFSVDPYGNKAKRQRSTLAWQKLIQDCGSNTTERPKVAPFPVVTPEGKLIKKEPNMFSSTLMMPGLGGLANTSQLYPSCSQLAHTPGKQDVLSPCWLHGSTSSAGLLGSHPPNSFSSEPQLAPGSGSSSLPAFHDSALAWSEEKDSGFFRTYGSTNGLGAVVVSGPELQSLSGGASGMLGMDTDDINCGSISLEKFSAVLGAGSQRQQLQLPPAGAAPGSGAAAFAAQPSLADAVYGFMEQEVLSEPRLSGGHQGGLADGQFYDPEGVHGEELYQSFPFDNILQSYNP